MINSLVHPENAYLLNFLNFAQNIAENSIKFKIFWKMSKFPLKLSKIQNCHWFSRDFQNFSDVLGLSSHEPLTRRAPYKQSPRWTSIPPRDSWTDNENPCQCLSKLSLWCWNLFNYSKIRLKLVWELLRIVCIYASHALTLRIYTYKGLKLADIE